MPTVPSAAYIVWLMLLPTMPVDQLTLSIDDDLDERIANVNDGELVFLPVPPSSPIHRHHNEITLSKQSLADGWIKLRQCHSHLDPVSATQIVYHPQRIRRLRVVSTKNIGAGWVEGASVQLSNVRRSARICIQADSRALQPLPNGQYRLRNGPYMRKFLDGYYPLQVTLQIRYPPELLQLKSFSPSPQPGLRVDHKPGNIRLEGWFEGRLFTKFDFAVEN